MIDKKSKIITGCIVNTILVLTGLFCLLPLILVVAVSFSSMDSILTSGYSFIPKTFTLKAYSYLFTEARGIFQGYLISISTSLLGGVLSTLITAMVAYPISRSDYKFSGKVTFYIFFTMLFNGGLVPWYMLISNYLKLKDTFWVLILPYVVLGWNVMLMRTFFKSVPVEVTEAAEVDGANVYRVFFQIVLPMSKPALATIGLLSLLRYWNDWWLALLFIENEMLVPLQYLLYRMMSNIEELLNQSTTVGTMVDINDFPTEPARMAMAVVAAGPMLFLFPFFQKYFVRGMTVGAVKG